MAAHLLDAFGFASGFSALVLYACRQRFFRLSPGQQLIFALTTWTVHLGVFCYVFIWSL